jgi:GT2 family glycosyltransferase
MDEQYFLYFEDLEWGIRAKRKLWKLGYADRSIVAHKGGTTIGSSRTRAGASILSVYLDFRNRVIFVRAHYPRWIFWTLFVLVLRALEFSLAGATRNTRAALNGIAAAIRGEIGRPEIAGAARFRLPVSVRMRDRRQ